MPVVLTTHARERQLMRTRTHRRGARRPPRLHCLPAVILREPDETLEGQHALAESPDDLGLLLWRTARDVTLWAGTSSDARATLFSDRAANARLALLAAAESPEKIAGSLDTLHCMLAAPGRADAEVIAICCLEIAAWARGAGLPRTAILIAQAGALAAPEFGEAALHVALCAREAGQAARAETWLRRAMAVSRREGDRTAYAGALCELGVLHHETGRLAAAKRLYRRAFRAGRRYRARAVRMRAAHGLFRLAHERGDQAGARRAALAAQRAFEADRAGASGILLDVARFWTDSGEPEQARSALRMLSPMLGTLPRSGQLAALALIARTEFEAGRTEQGAAAAAGAWSLLADDAVSDPVRCTAAFDLAYAAGLRGDASAFRAAERCALRFASASEFAGTVARLAAIRPRQCGSAPVGPAA